MITNRLGEVARTWAPPTMVVLFALAGCARKSGPFEQWIRADESALWSDAQSPQDEYANPAEPAADGRIDTFDQDKGPEPYVRIALHRNPSIRAARQKAAALAQRIPQVTSLSDPMLEVAPIGDMAETAAGSVSVMTGVSQRFPLGGKLSAAGDTAEWEVAGALAELVEREQETAVEVRRAYWSYYQTARGMETIAQSRASLEQLTAAAEAQYKAGRATQQDVLRASVELAELDTTLATLERRRASAIAMLNQLMDRPVDDELPTPAPVSISEATWELDALLQRAAQCNPSLQKISASIEADRRRIRLAELQRVPDLNVSLSYNFVDDDGLSPVANGDDQWWVGFGINLPIWQDRLEAAEREARLNVLRGSSELAQEKNIISYRVQDAVLAAHEAQRRATLFRDVVLPQARQTIDASLSGYRAGGVDYLTVNDNWRRSLEFELMYHESVAQYMIALAELDQAVGRSMDDVMQESRDE